MKRNFCRFVFLSLLALNFNLLFAQNATNQWRFGEGAAVDFNSGSPVSVSGAMCYTSEGCASIADTAGNLLFYTDGITVWNKNNSIMFNGTGLLGDYSSSQSGIIVQLPGSDSLYYIFTVDEQATQNGLEYSIVDMSQQGGLGAVIIKNIMVITPTTEKVTAVCQSNGIDFWIITHDWNNNHLLAYSLTNAGFNNTAVVSIIGSVSNGSDWNTIGYLKASPNGKYLAQAIWGANYFELFSFNDTTGVVSHALLLPSYAGASSGAYGCEFSPDSKRLYGAVITPGNVYQWDVSATTDSAILASKILVGNSAIGFNGALQQASDGKIYLAEYGSSWLGAINDPDSLGVACNFVDHGFQMSFGTNGLGLPNYFPCLFEPPANPAPSPSIAISNPEICEKFCVDYYDSSLNNPTSWLWTFDGGSPPTSNAQNPTNICYTVPGTYDVTLTVTNANGSNTLTFANYITVYATPPFPTITQNGFVLTSSAATSYQWQFNSYDIPGATNQSYTVMQTGFYTVIIGDAHGCVNAATQYVLIDGINDLLYEAGIFISPNPSDGNFTIDFSNSKISASNLEIDVVNAIGQNVFSSKEKSFAGLKKEINLVSVSHGVYLVELKMDDRILRKKILITNK